MNPTPLFVAAAARLLGPSAAGTLTLLLLLTAACTSDGPTRQEQARVREFAARGYAAAAQAAVTTADATWALPGLTVRLVLARPATAAHALPVVIYLPGLGETGDAGPGWRMAWAAAGYAVVSVQPLDDDATAWQSQLAREGEFKALGRQHYAGAMMNRRVRALADLVAEGRRRSAGAEPPWQSLDWDKVAVAGYDLGAYTAMTVAGEHVRGAEDARDRLQIRAAIALSPYADLAGGAIDERYRDIVPPVMSVTSDVDADPLGLVEGATLRDAPFSRMPGPDKYLLTLQGLPHSGLSGNPEPRRANPDGDASRRSRGDEAGAGGEGGQRRRGSRQSGSGGTGEGGRQSADRSAGGAGAVSYGLSATALQTRIIAAQDISTAFLDAYLKDDRLAREWLAADAGRWLGATGQLRRK